MNFILLILLFFAFQFAAAQEKIFDVVLLGKNIGQTTVVKKQDSQGHVSYNLNSNSNIQIFTKSRSSSMSFDIEYWGGKLYSAICDVISDGTQIITEISKNPSGYLIKKGNEIAKITDAVTYSSMELYFSEPINQKKVFSERMGEFVSFEKTAPGEYVNKLPDVTNIYRYRNGALYEVEMKKKLGSAYLRARE